MPPSSFLSGYKGTVNHARFSPASHAFTYDVCLFLVDIDKPEDGFAHLPSFLASATSKWAVATYRDGDHFAGRQNGESLSAGIRRLIKEKTGEPEPKGRILLLTHLAFFGYCFNPAAFYFVLKEEKAEDGKSGQPASASLSASLEDRLECIVIEVTNTPWGEQHHYVLHPKSKACAGEVAAWRRRMTGKDEFEGRKKPSLEAPGEEEGAEAWIDTRGSQPFPSPSPSKAPPFPLIWHRFAWGKAFHVSPFFPLNHHYDWCFSGMGPSSVDDTQQGECDALQRISIYSRNYQLPQEKSATTGPFKLDSSAPVIFTTTTKLLRYDAQAFASSPSSSAAWRRMLDCVVNAFLSLLILAFSCGSVRPNDKGKGGNNITPLAMARLVLFIFPLLTLRVQWWIHKEAVALFKKGVPIFPHPNNATSFFTDVVAAIAAFVLPIVNAVNRLKGGGSQGVTERKEGVKAKAS